MKFRGHETFFIRKGWLGKGMKYVRSTGGEVFIVRGADETPSDILGLGTNMVKSLRYWLLATGLTEEPPSGRKVQSLTDFGSLVYEHDRYLEETGTLQLIQYKLASNRGLATSWHFFFNRFDYSEFGADDFVLSVRKWLKDTVSDDDTSGKIRALTDDFNCIVATYCARPLSERGRKSPENNIDCPLAELGLVEVCDKKKKTFRKAVPATADFNPWIVLAVVIDGAEGRAELSLDSLLHGDSNIGRVFNLDSIALIDLLRGAEKTGELKIVRTAGLDVVRLSRPERTFLDCVERYYKTIGVSLKNRAR